MCVMVGLYSCCIFKYNFIVYIYIYIVHDIISRVVYVLIHYMWKYVFDSVRWVLYIYKWTLLVVFHCCYVRRTSDESLILETSVSVYQPTRRNIPEGLKLKSLHFRRVCIQIKSQRPWCSQPNNSRWRIRLLKVPCNLLFSVPQEVYSSQIHFLPPPSPTFLL
jgi:hypothetical protein